MSISFNSATIAGNLGKDPEIIYSQSGTAIANFSIAVSDKYKKGDDWIERTDWFDVTAFGRQAETSAEYLKKGSSVLIDGKLKQETWDKDGQKRSKVKIIANRIVFLGKSEGEKKEEDKAVPF